MSRRIKKTTKACLQCKKEFHPFNSLNKFCSHRCYMKHTYHSGKVDCTKLRECKQCHKEFKAWNFRAQFCSRECSYKFRKTISLENRECIICKKPFHPVRKSSSFCSAECHKKWRSPGLRKKRWEDMPHKGKVTHLDFLWADAIKRRAGYKCEVCDKPTGLNSHHIFSRSNHTMRWELDNGIALCVAHHVFGLFSAHKSPIEFAEWLKEKRGEEWYNQLRAKAKMIRPQAIVKEEAKQILENFLKESNGQKVPEEGS